MKKVFLILSVVFCFSVVAQEKQVVPVPTYVEGKHYTVLDPIIETSDDKQVIIYEFFGYKCPHCSSFQAFVKPWQEKLPKHVKLVRVPVLFQDGWDVFAKAYYTSEAMGIVEETHQAMFDALHKQRKKFRTIEDIASWYAKTFNIDKESFLSTASSFMIDSKIRQSNNLMRKMKIISTPTVVINGKYTPNKKGLKSNHELLDVAAFLASKEARLMGLIE